jgi:thiol:disulfide interchange protein DsbD
MAMRASFLTLIYILLSGTWAFGQEKIQWDFSLNSSRCIEAKAQIETGWHIYSIHLEPEAGPVPTQITLEKNKAVNLTDPWMEVGQMIEHFDPNFGATVHYFEKEYTLIAPVFVKKPTTVKGELTYMLCDDKRCLPPKTIPFEIKVTPYQLEKPN